MNTMRKLRTLGALVCVAGGGWSHGWAQTESVPTAAQTKAPKRLAAPATAPAGAAEPAVAAAASNAFGIDLYRHLAAGPGNLFFSPYSLTAALSMTYAGAGGVTAEQMATVLHLPAGETVHAAFGGLDAALTGGTDPNRCVLVIANALWLQEGFAVHPAFSARVQNDYHAMLGGVDFRQAVESARGHINGWVREKTQSRIPELLGPGAVNNRTRCVLTNAIYLKAAWEQPFEARATNEGAFHLADGRTLPTPFMRQTKACGYAEVAGAQLLELPYVGGDLAMLVVLPRAVDELPAVERMLTVEQLQQWTAQIRSQRVVVVLPRFELEAALDGGAALRALGMEDAFAPPRADFSRLSDAEGLHISSVRHQANITVNEAGTEAAAATAIGVGITSIPPRSLEFKADHPFLFLIRHRASGAVLFLGRFVEPPPPPAAPPAP